MSTAEFRTKRRNTLVLTEPSLVIKGGVFLSLDPDPDTSSLGFSSVQMSRREARKLAEAMLAIAGPEKKPAKKPAKKRAR